MKRVLITGENSYIGNSFKDWLVNNFNDYTVYNISLKNENWRNKDFSKYDIIFHVAGIAHVSSKSKVEDIYYKINRDLSIELAKKAKKEGVKQFIFMSSIIVYGSSMFKTPLINKNTLPRPNNSYGKSKLQAEEGLLSLQDKGFQVAVLRPPMIYGRNAKGNYMKLKTAAKKLPLFPWIENQRSMLYIENLCEFVRLIIDNEENGIYFPQNREYVKTSEMVRLIAKSHGNQIRFTKLFNPLIMLAGNKIQIIDKVFGDLVYDKEMSNYKNNYIVKEFEESIVNTEMEKS